MLAKLRHAPAEVRRRRGEMERRARRLDGPVADRDRHDRLAVAEHRPAQHLLHVRHDRERQAQLQPEGEPFLGRTIEEARDEARLQRIGPRQPFAAHDVIGIAAELRHAHQVAERFPLRRRDDGDADPALLAAIDAHRIGRREAVEAPALLRARRPGLDRLVFGERDRRLVDAHLPGSALSAQQRRHRRNEGRKPAHDRRLIVRQGERRSFGRSDQLHEAREGAAHRIGRLEVAIRAGLAEPAQIHRHEMRMGRMIEAGRIDQHIGAAQQCIEIDRVRRDALLAVVEIGEPAAGLRVDHRRKGAGRIAVGRLDLDDLGAEIGKQPRGIGAGRQGPQLDDPVRRERTRHCFRPRLRFRFRDRRNAAGPAAPTRAPGRRPRRASRPARGRR